MAIIEWVLILLFAGGVTAIIVSLPHENYVLEGNRGTVRCQNRSDNERIFYSYVTNAVWYRDYGNGTHEQIGSSGPIYSYKHLLSFKPTVRKADEGVYYCCTPSGLCGNSSKRNTVVRISTPPVISAEEPKYTSIVGANIILRCYIIDKGIPQAVFSWKKDGNRMNGEYVILINSSVMELTIKNLTLDNAGIYTCIANGLLSYRSDSVELIVEEEIQIQVVQVLAVDLFLPCSVAEPVKVDAELHNYIQKICNCTNFKVNTTLLKCVGNDRALYTVQLTGSMIDDILQLWSDDEINGSQGIDIGVATISLCNNDCFIHEQRISTASMTTVPTYLIIIFAMLSTITHTFDCSSCNLMKIQE